MGAGCFSSLELITPTLARVREGGLALILIAPHWLGKHWLAHGSMGLTRERLNLTTSGPPQSVVATIQSARAASTRHAYDGKWHAFEDRCRGKSRGGGFPEPPTCFSDISTGTTEEARHSPLSKCT